MIYNKSKAAPQRPSHDTVPRKHAANLQGNTSRRSVTQTKLLLCNFTETKMEKLRGVASDAFTTHSS